MNELTLTTPTLLFSAVSLILLAYTNRFLSYAQLVRTLKEQYVKEHSEVTAAQIANSPRWDFPSGKSRFRSRPWKSTCRTWRTNRLVINN